MWRLIYSVTSQVLVNDVLENDEAMMAIFKWFVKQFFLKTLVSGLNTMGVSNKEPEFKLGRAFC